MLTCGHMTGLNFPLLVQRELNRARTIHRIPLHSPHEAESVIREEFEEFVQLVRVKDHGRSRLAMLTELTHVAAMAQRAAEDLGLANVDSKEVTDANATDGTH